MVERLILFSDPMVRAILEGKKTQTRRMIKGQRDMEFDINDPHFGPYWLSYATDAEGEDARVRCPYGKPGDRLWVREAHRYWWPDWEDPGSNPCRCRYKADDATLDLPVSWNEEPNFDTPEDQGLDIEPFKWRPSIFMPRWASRITLEITGVRVERLQQVSGPDCWEEGISHAGWDPERYGSVVECYRDLWQSIHGAGSWDANPWVWVVEFRRLTPSSHCALERGDKHQPQRTL